MGHTDADYEQARAAIQEGARHAVHVYNAMRPFTHRDPGILAAIMTDPEVTAEIIADGIHVAAPAIQMLIGTKGFTRCSPSAMASRPRECPTANTGSAILR